MRLTLASVFAMMVSAALLLPPADAVNAKDLYYEQLAAPSQETNTGFAYWIELRRGAKISKVDSRFQFKTGDRIRFHMIPDTDGYAHVVLLRGTTGKQSVLFPVAGKDPSNRVKRGKDYTIPSTTFLQFDAHKGREQVRVAFSRRSVNTAMFLKPGAELQLAMATISSNPAVDPTAGKQQLQVAFGNDLPKTPAPTVESSEDAIPDEPSAADNSKDLFREDSAPHAVHHVHHTTGAHSQPHRPNTHAHHPHSVHHSAAASYVIPTPPPSTYVVNTNPDQDLYAEITLEHS